MSLSVVDIHILSVS